MNSDLPATGTVALLELLDPLVPDDFINQVWPHGRYRLRQARPQPKLGPYQDTLTKPCSTDP